jgi:hypothetical protein
MAPNSSTGGSSDPGAGSAVPLGDNSASASIVEQARGRSDGFDMGGDRAIASTPNWNSQESYQLYQGAVMNNDPGTAEATGHAWTSHGNALSDASNHLYNAIAELGAGWVGEGAAAAQGALVGIANSGSQASEAAHTMATRLAQQAAAAAEVKKMPKPKDYDPAQAMTAALAGGPAAMIADQKAQADAAADVKGQQVAFFNAYTKAMSEVDGSTPSFGPESLGMKPTAGHNSAGFNHVGGIGHAGDISGVGAGGASNVFGPGSPAFGGAHGGAAASGVPDTGHLSQAGYNPGTLDSGPGVAAAVGPVSGTGAHTPLPSGSSGGGSHVGQALGLGALGGGLGFVASRALGKGNRSGSRSDSTAASANENSAQSAASTPAPQHGIVSPGGTIGGAPTPPPPGMGMGMGAGASQREDEEHTHASFLIDPDPDETFGANEATPPPVIGAWSQDDDR